MAQTQDLLPLEINIGLMLRSLAEFGSHNAEDLTGFNSFFEKGSLWSTDKDLVHATVLLWAKRFRKPLSPNSNGFCGLIFKCTQQSCSFSLSFSLNKKYEPAIYQVVSSSPHDCQQSSEPEKGLYAQDLCTILEHLKGPIHSCSAKTIIQYIKNYHLFPAHQSANYQYFHGRAAAILKEANRKLLLNPSSCWNRSNQFSALKISFIRTRALL